MQKVSIKDARTNLSSIVEDVSERQKTYVVTKYGKPRALIKPVTYKNLRDPSPKEDKKLKALNSSAGMWKDKDYDYKRENSRYENIFD
ncbi:type II toxin-antitoxin system prevent-host-death family antitoxin [candidate division WWE3 bacterium]|nr:type II toxin-antitoxin system prevent-host-death family antitoxin [candidate division WWE3 bacterium]